MDAVINIEDASWSRRNQRSEKLKEYQPMEGSNEVNKMMKKRLYESARNCDVDIFLDDLELVSTQDQISLSTILKQVSPCGNSLLQVAASYGCKEITELLGLHCPELITRKNFQGDTAIHLAARAGKLNTLTSLIDRVEKRSDGFLWFRNNKGNTPLHEAVINKQYEVADLLLRAYPQVAYYQNGEGSIHHGENIKRGKSPLYLAAEIGDEKMLGHLLQAIAQDGAQSLDDLEGLSPAHAAVKHKTIGILEKIAEIKPELLRAKETGKNNALHFASSIGYLEGVQFLLLKYSDGAIEENEEGLYPIHVACKKGNLKVVKELLKQWPDPAEFLNSKGQNILHVAAEYGRENVVSMILRDPELKLRLINEKDEDGNAPLHLATKYCRSTVVFALVLDQDLNKSIVNAKNLTPYGEAFILSTEMEQKADSPNSDAKVNQHQEIMNENKDIEGPKIRDYFDMMVTFSILHFSSYHSLLDEEDKKMQVKRKPLSDKDIKKRVENLLVVAVLVAGATFAGVIQVPGGGSHNKKNGILLSFYFVFDMAAFTSSVMASLLLGWMQVYNMNFITQAVWAASGLVGFSLFWLFLAFVAAIAIATRTFPVMFAYTFVAGGLSGVGLLWYIFPLLTPDAGEAIEMFVSPAIYVFFLGVYSPILCKQMLKSYTISEFLKKLNDSLLKPIWLPTTRRQSKGGDRS